MTTVWEIRARVTGAVLRCLVLVLLALLSACGVNTGPEGGGTESLGTIAQATTTTCLSAPLPGECRYSPLQAHASSVESSGSTYAPENAIDGSCSTRWSSAFSDPQWLKVDLGSSRPLSRVIVHWESAASSSYEIQVSEDAATWTKVATNADATIVGSGNSRVDTIAGLTASARFLRVYSTARTTSYGDSIFELEVFGTGCGPAPGCSQIPVFPVAAAASSIEHSGKLAQYAIDGLSSTRWGSQFSDPQWLRLDLGESQAVSRVVIDWENAASAKYDLQISDSATGPWTVIGSYANAGAGPRTDDIGGLTGSGRYLRIYSTKRTTAYGNSIFEVRVFRESCDACEQLLTASSAQASSTEASSYGAQNAVDGDYGTRWSSAFSDPQWLRLDFGDQRRVTQVIIKWENAASKSYRLEGAELADGPWTKIAERSNQPSGPRVDVIKDISAVARYLRVYSTARTTSYGDSIYEIMAIGAQSANDCKYCADDDDGDGVKNCQDECPLDPNKTTPGLCNCGVSEEDSDSDSVPDCIDECKLDAQSAYSGQCKCPSDPTPNGTPCTDGITPGSFTCNNGICGDPNAAAPQAGCFYKTSGWHVYWFCPAATLSDATARCAQVPGRRLIQIDTRQENSFAAQFVTAESWIGASDRTTEGEWSWLDAAGQDKKQFWTGGSGGSAFKGLFQSWLGGNPGSDASKDCATLSMDRAWRPQNCSGSRPYVCEGLFGPGWTPGPGSSPHVPVGPAGIIPGWATSSNGGGDGGDGSDVSEADCIPEPAGADLALQDAQLEACDERCGEGATNPATEDECKALCTGAAQRPPAGSQCSGNGEPLSQVELTAAGIGKCSVENQDCSQMPGTHCGVQTKCLDVTKETGAWAARTCAEGCRSGTQCDVSLGKCVNPALHNVCDQAREGPDCFGQCFSEIGCGTGGYGLAESSDELCDETRWCSPPYTAGLNAGSNLLDQTPWSDSALPDLTESMPPQFSNDFEQPCTSSPCALCLGDAADDPNCLRLARHSWCSYEQATVGTSSAGVTDGKQGDRGTESSVVKFDVDPAADLNFDVKPLPFGVSDFKVEAAAAVRASAAFNLGPIRGAVELVDLRGALEASLCRASTKSSHIEVLGLDFLPKLVSLAPAAQKAIFDTDESWTGAAACKQAVADYIEAVDRAKKALRDAQELIRQFEDLKQVGRTFNAEFCETVAGAGLRPPGMEGSCDVETPADTVNRFIDYYRDQASKIGGALDTLSKSVLNSSALAQLLGETGGSGFTFYAPLGSPDQGVGSKETTTILEMNFLVGPVPCNLEVTAYMNYGLKGGFGADLQPSALISGGGTFAKAGAIITPYADAGVTLFVGAGFSAGPFSLKLGIEGAVTLANIELPATAAAGLSMVPDKDDRPLPSDLQDITNYEVLFPHSSIGPQKFNFQFDYSYGVDFTASDMLSGEIDAALKIKFLFFSKKFSKKIVSFDSGLQVGPINLIGGGSFNQNTHKHEEPVVNDVKTWKSTYASVPFMGLRHVSMPAAPVADASFDSARATALFYDTLCKCDQNGAACNRSADCCSDTASCFDDQTLGQHYCRECGQPDYMTRCNIDDDCCGDSICSDADYEVCDDDCTPGSGGTLNICVPNCQTVHPPTKICQPPPGDSNPPSVVQ